MSICIFCGRDRTLSAEHVYSAWLRPYLHKHPEDGDGTHHHIHIHRGGPDVQTYSAPPATQTVRSVCAECNNGWMSQLESGAKPCLESMIKGHQRTYYAGGQELIATWLVKTALVSGSKFDPRLPASFYTDLYETRKPSPNTRVWIAGTAYEGQHYIDYRPLRSVADGEPRPEAPIIPNAYSAVLAVGQFAGMIVSWEGQVPSMDRIESHYGPALIELLQGHPVTWPPRGGRLDFRGLEDLADSVVTIEAVMSGNPLPN
jgi:hypothetical protein